MRSIYAALAAGLALIAACTASARPRGNSGGAPPGELRDVESELIALVQFMDSAAAAGDIDRFLSVFVEGPELAFAMNGRVFTDRAEVRAAHLAAFAKLASVRYATRPTRIAHLGPDHAALTAIGETERVLRTGEHRVGQYAVTLVLRRTSQGWRVLQVHESSRAND